MKRHARKDAGLRPVKSIPIETPSFQNWSCRGCANCCRDTLRVELSAEEQQLLAAQGWSQTEGVDPASMIVTEGGRARLGHRSDGACVFLDAASRCRIHAKFGEPAKPLACRSFPFALHPAGRKLVASLRFSCPGAVENLGPPLAAQTADLRELAEAVVPAGCDRRPPPSVWREPGLDWEDFLRYVGWLDRTLADEDVPSALKVCRALSWLQAVAKASFDGLTGPAADEILAALVGSAARKFPAPPDDGAKPSSLGGFLLRQLAIECACAPALRDRRLASAYRWKQLWLLVRIAGRAGHLPSLGGASRKVRFEEIEKPRGPLPAAAEAMLTRFLRVKVRGLHFCGPAFYDASLIAGFQSLTLAFAAVLWLARWQAAAAGRSNPSELDVARSMMMVDHHHGHAWPLSMLLDRLRIPLLTQRDDLTKLCLWYAR